MNVRLLVLASTAGLPLASLPAALALAERLPGARFVILASLDFGNALGHFGRLLRRVGIVSALVVNVDEPFLQLTHGFLEFGAGKFFRLGCDLKERVEDSLVEQRVLEARDLAEQLFDSLVVVLQQRETMRKVSPLLHLLRRAEAVAQFFNQAHAVGAFGDKRHQVVHNAFELVRFQPG